MCARCADMHGVLGAVHERPCCSLAQMCMKCADLGHLSAAIDVHLRCGPRAPVCCDRRPPQVWTHLSVAMCRCWVLATVVVVMQGMRLARHSERGLLQCLMRRKSCADVLIRDASSISSTPSLIFSTSKGSGGSEGWPPLGVASSPPPPHFTHTQTRTRGVSCVRVPLGRWVSNLEEELFRQGDQEKLLGLSVSPLFDRDKPGVTKSQVGRHGGTGGRFVGWSSGND